MRNFLLLSLFLCMIGTSVLCTADDQPPAAVRTANREQALATLDSPDPIARLSAMEDILDGKDSILKMLAARKVFSGTDADLRTLALRYFLSKNDRQYNFVIDDCRSLRQNDGCTIQELKLKGVIPLMFLSMNIESGELKVISLYSNYENGGLASRPGRITHGEAIFDVSIKGEFKGNCNDFTFHLKNVNGNRYMGTVTCGDAYQMTGGFDLF